MKKLFALFVAVLVCTSLFAVEVKNEVVHEKEFDSPQTIKIAKLWVSEKYISGKDVIDAYDEELNILTGNGMVDFHTSILPTEFHYKFKITIKGNKVKIVFNTFRAGTKQVAISKRTGGLQDFYNQLDKLAKSLFEYYSEF